MALNLNVIMLDGVASGSNASTLRLVLAFNHEEFNRTAIGFERVDANEIPAVFRRVRVNPSSLSRGKNR